MKKKRTMLSDFLLYRDGSEKERRDAAIHRLIKKHAQLLEVVESNKLTWSEKRSVALGELPDIKRILFRGGIMSLGSEHVTFDQEIANASGDEEISQLLRGLLHAMRRREKPLDDPTLERVRR